MLIGHRKEIRKLNDHDVSSVSPSSERRANARNVSFRISLRWQFHIINSVDKTKLSHLKVSHIFVNPIIC